MWRVCWVPSVPVARHHQAPNVPPDSCFIQRVRQGHEPKPSSEFAFRSARWANCRSWTESHHSAENRHGLISPEGSIAEPMMSGGLGHRFKASSEKTGNQQLSVGEGTEGGKALIAFHRKRQQSMWPNMEEKGVTEPHAQSDSDCY